MIDCMFEERYRIVEHIGEGGMADVFRAVDITTEKQVAIKIIKNDHIDNDEIVKRFDNEARAGMKLCHKNIISVLDRGRHEGRAYIVLEYCDGVTLREIINENHKLDVDICIDITVQVLEALGHAHEKGIVHRDIKPQNILIQEDGLVKVYDFGIAESIHDPKDTNDTNVLGTVNYVSPEQARADKVGPQSDLYSLGITMFEMLTGRLPFSGESIIDVAKKHVNEQVPAVSSIDEKIPMAISQCIQKATRKDVRLRYKSCQAMKKDLLRAKKEPNGDFVHVRQERITSQDENLLIKHVKTAKRRIYLIASVVVLVIAAVLILSILKQGDEISKHEGKSIPSLVGLSQEEAIKKIEELGMSPNPIPGADSTREDGIVFKQVPAAGETLVEGGTVDIYVGVAETESTTPNVLYLELSQAQNIIRNNNLMVGSVLQEQSDEPSGYVIRQEPMPGEDIAAGEQVNLWVSGGKAQSMSSSSDAVEVE